MKDKNEQLLNYKVDFSKLNEYEIKDERYTECLIKILHLGRNYNGSVFKKEVVDKAIEWVRDWKHGANDWFEEDSKPSELLDILKEVE